ncbi:MAG: hypothetical protein V3W41_08260 [Planctomycetota bacterium]
MTNKDTIVPQESAGSALPPDLFSDRLRRFSARVRRLLALRGLLIFLAWALALALLTFALDRVLRLSLTARTIVGLGAIAWLVWITWKECWRPLVGNWSGLDVAASLDRLGTESRARTFIVQRLATSTQLGAELDARSKTRPHDDRQSLEFMREAVAKSRQELNEYDLDQHIDSPLLRRRVTLLAALIALPLLLIFVAPDSTSLWFKRWFLGSEERWPQETYLELLGTEDGEMIVARSEAVEFRVRARKGSVVPDRIEIDYELDGGPRISNSLTRFGPNDFRFQLPGVRDRALVWLVGGDDRAGPFTLIAKDRPRVESFSVHAQLKAAGSSEKFEFARQDESIAFRKDSKVTLRVRASEEIAALDLRQEQAEGVVVEELSAFERKLSWSHLRRRNLSIELVSRATGLRSRPTSLDFGLKEDSAPRITVAVEGVRDRITPRALVPLTVVAQDDYGLSDLTLHWSSSVSPEAGEGAAAKSAVLFNAPDGGVERSVEEKKELDLALASSSALKLEPGTFLRVEATAKDRCHLGPQTGKSRLRVFRIVSPEQLFREIALRLQRTRSRFRKSRDRAKKLQDVLVQAQSESKALVDPADALRRLRLVERQVWSTNRVLEASIRELVLNRLVEKEAEELLERNVLRPLRRLQNVELKNQRRQFERFGLATADAPSMDEMATGQALVVRGMQRVLDGMKQWDSFVDLINQLNEVIKLQSGVRSETLDAKGEAQNGK